MTIYSLMTSVLLSLNMLLVVAACKILCICIVLPILLMTWRKVYKRKRAERQQKGTVVGFFHPYCNAGGGGERVLWAAVKAIQTKYPHVHIVIYTGDLNVDPEQIIKTAETVFNFKIEPGVEFIYLHRRKWVEAYMYPYFTLLGQSLGSMWLGLEALNSYVPDIYIDTMGYAFTYPLFKYIGGCRIATYTHYPTISTDMLKHVYRRVISHNNNRIIARNPFLSAAKIAYYKLFAFFITLALWLGGQYCRDYYVSVAQFRPEKNHPLMLRAMYELRSIIKEEVWEKVRLIFIGSCRNSDDEVRVKDMQDLSKHFALDENVEFKLNVPYSELVSELQKGMIGLHAMWNEHFGISIIESMAAGLIMVAHASGGPKADIIETQPSSQNGFLAEEAEEYAAILAHIINMHSDDRNTIKMAARASVSRFSDEVFEKEFLRTVEPFFRPKQE
ncbi:hypothetical protein KM043_012894 [Ampulex compressa]|nr:hypothetical protein KM043_012894 [Ampulex compressa]